MSTPFPTPADKCTFNLMMEGVRLFHWVISLETVPLVINIKQKLLLSTGVRNGEGRQEFMNDYTVYDPGKLKENANYTHEK